MIDENIFSKERNFHGVKGIIFIDNKMLVYRRDTNTDSFPLYIDLPGGGRDTEESPFETFKRESKEEFNISIDKDDIIYAKKYMSPIDPTKESYFFVTKYLDAKSHPIKFGDEGLKFFLVEINKYLEMGNVIERQKVKVKEYLVTL